MIKLATDPQTFHVVGIARNFKLKDKNCIDRFDLMTDQGKYRFKIPAKLHKRLDIELFPLMKLEVRGIIQAHPKKRKVKLKIQHITPLFSTVVGDRHQSSPRQDIAETTQEIRQTKPQQADGQPQLNGKLSKKNKILICKKSNCWKKGGQQAYENLQQAIDAKGLNEQVNIKTTGCMDRCKKAPNVVVMPDKEKYTHFVPSNAEELVQHHFGDLTQ